MRKRSVSPRELAEKVARDIGYRTSKQYSVEEKIRIVMGGLGGEQSIARLCRREGIAESSCYLHGRPSRGKMVWI